MNKTIYLYRHGETELNRKGIVQGSGVDFGLNEKGRSQADAFFHHYRDFGFEVVITSKLKRTHETVSSFVEKGIPWVQYPEINEISWGDHEGKESTPELIAVYKKTKEQWLQGNFDAHLPNGESAAELSARVGKFIEKLKARPESLVLVCAHGRTMRCIMTHFRGEDLREMEKYHHRNTGLYVISYNGQGFEVKAENDFGHLELPEKTDSEFL